MRHRHESAALLCFVLLIAACGKVPPSDRLTLPPTTTETRQPILTPTPHLPPTLAPTLTPTLEPIDARIEGVTLNEAYGITLGHSLQVQFVIDRYIKPSGANYVTLIPLCLMEDWHDTRIQCDFRPDAGASMPTDADLISAIQRLHASGLRVMLKPHVNVRLSLTEHRYANLGEFWSESQWLQWFDSYVTFITRYARLAEDNQVDLFVVGNELESTTHREADWRRVIAAVRQTYHGPITYAAISWMFEASRIEFWDALDYIATNWYFSSGSPSDATVAGMMDVWEPIISRLRAMSEQFGKQVIITEIGPPSSDQQERALTYWWVCGAYDADVQARYYQAFFDSILGEPWLKGIVIWSLDTDPMQGGPGDIGPNFVGKPSERLVQDAFQGAPLPRPTPEAPTPWRQDRFHSIDIYRNGFQSGWRQAAYSAATSAQVGVPVAPVGTSAIWINMASVGELDIYPGRVLPMGRYKWIEFEVMFERQVPLSFYIAFARSTDHGDYWSKALDILTGDYHEDKDLRVGRWYRFSVPLSDMGITDQAYPSLHFMATSRGWCITGVPADVYLNNIRLVAGVRLQPTPTVADIVQ